MSTPKAVVLDAGDTDAVRPNLRARQKAQTRHLIVTTALRLFDEKGYVATTMDQIALDVGASRATIYLHFPDKEAILSAIIEDYLARATRQMARLPGPCPTRGQIEAWMHEIVAFSKRERASISLIVIAASMGPKLAHVQSAVVEPLIRALGEAVPAFAHSAASRNGDPRLVHAESVLAQISWAAQSSMRSSSLEYQKVALEIAVDAIERFINHPRFGSQAS